MKITGIEIGEYRQFKNIKFDFTYPEGHPKAGQPLEKVCFIGQSGTGKTTLLNVIWDFLQISDDLYKSNTPGNIRVNNANHYRTFQTVSIKAIFREKPFIIDKSVVKEPDERSGSIFKFDDSSLINQAIRKIREDLDWKKLASQEQAGKIGLYIDEQAVSLAGSLLFERKTSENHLVSLYNEPTQDQYDNELLKLRSSNIIGLSRQDPTLLWSYLLSDIENYDEALKQVATDLIQKQSSFSPDRLANTLRQWQAKYFNPRVDIAEKCLNLILRHFYLEVDIAGTESRIVLKTVHGFPESGRFLSTGTKQILTTAIPVYKSNIRDGIILFDEPERSLFPDIQQELVKYYTGLAPEAQFFFATHSPIIAAAFEPEERFILYFDEDGEVKYRKGVAPIGDDPNDILHDDFGLKEVMLDEGLAAYKRYRNLFVEIKSEKDPDRKKELVVEQAKLGDQYKF